MEQIKKLRLLDELVVDENALADVDKVRRLEERDGAEVVAAAQQRGGQRRRGALALGARDVHDRQRGNERQQAHAVEDHARRRDVAVLAAPAGTAAEAAHDVVGHGFVGLDRKRLGDFLNWILILMINSSSVFLHNIFFLLYEYVKFNKLTQNKRQKTHEGTGENEMNFFSFKSVFLFVLFRAFIYYLLFILHFFVNDKK